MDRIVKKNKRKKLRILRIILIFIILSTIINVYKKYHNSISKFINDITTSSNYKVIKQDYNENYDGKGQETVKNKDGYFTTFTTGGENKKIYIEYKQNGNSSWKDNMYWGGTMEQNGCGITVMSIILSGYEKNFSPEDLRKKYYPVLNYGNFSKELSKTFNIENSDFYYDEPHRSKKSLTEHLLTNRPIIICVWNENGKNRWTNKSHYMALLATDGKDMVYISNPNGLENEINSSGWYNFSEITPYIAKALYVETY